MSSTEGGGLRQRRGGDDESADISPAGQLYFPLASYQFTWHGVISESIEYLSAENGPRPIQIVLVKEDHTFDLDMEALKSVLLSDKVRNRKVVVVSVAGAFRKGKSFLLDYLLRFLNNKVVIFNAVVVGFMVPP